MWRACLAAFAVCLAGSAGDVHAGCGDYLLPPVWIAKQQQILPEYARGQAYGRHNEPPCRGPRCQKIPTQNTPTPTVPSTLSVDQHWLATLDTLVTAFHRDDVRWQSLYNEAPVPHARGRLDRPPRG